jgi:hypothetical protein
MTSEVRTMILRFAAAGAIASYFRMYDALTLPESVRGTHDFTTRWLGARHDEIAMPDRPQWREGRHDSDQGVSDVKALPSGKSGG